MTTFQNAARLQTSVLNGIERRVLVWLAERMPRAVNSDHLTVLAAIAMAGTGLSYAWARTWPPALLLVNVFLAINWFGDSLDGTLARVRNRQRPRYGFYVDHVIDCLGATMMFVGLGMSGYMHLTVALAVLIAYLLLSAEVYLATYTRHTFRMTFFKLGPTELRILLAGGNVFALFKPTVTMAGSEILWLDAAGIGTAIGLGLTLLYSIVGNTRALYLEETPVAGKLRL
ncbi:MAG: CDP-alcohol phosphatidyltransferase family protein [Acidobacteria bacterium]|nr:MAG: CDP-alcohol phosphatidyltransferase family protein [Acidobacteriota bacterium]